MGCWTHSDAQHQTMTNNQHVGLASLPQDTDHACREPWANLDTMLELQFKAAPQGSVFVFTFAYACT